MTLEEAKLYLRVDGDEEDTLIQSLIDAAETYLARQTGKAEVIITHNDPETGLPVWADIRTDALWNLAVKLFLAHWYENRGVEKASSRANIAKISHSVDALVNHISMCGDYV